MNNKTHLDFLILGAQKCGTTALHEWLSKQEDVSLPNQKETRFFCDEDKYINGIDWYLNHFNKKGKNYILGEADPDCIFSEDAPLRIKNNFVNLKFIIIFRNPLHRAYSHYLMSTYRGYEKLSFIDALNAEEQRIHSEDSCFFLSHHSYLTRGKYSEQVRKYQSIFTENEFFFINYDEMFSLDKNKKIYTNICNFLGVKSNLIFPDLSKRVNAASEPYFKYLRDLIYSQSKIKKILKFFIFSISLRNKTAIWIDKVNRKNISKNDIEFDFYSLPNKYLEWSNNETLKLMDITNLDLNKWMYSIK